MAGERRYERRSDEGMEKVEGALTSPRRIVRVTSQDAANPPLQTDVPLACAPGSRPLNGQEIVGRTQAPTMMR